MSEEMGLLVEHLCSARHQEAVDGVGGVLPTGRQIFKESNKKDHSKTFDH
jgi:hypothetical protein